MKTLLLLLLLVPMMSFGQNNYSMSFDGNDVTGNDDYVEVANGENVFNITTEHGISAWVYPLNPQQNSAGDFVVF